MPCPSQTSGFNVPNYVSQLPEDRLEPISRDRNLSHYSLKLSEFRFYAMNQMATKSSGAGAVRYTMDMELEDDDVDTEDRNLAARMEEQHTTTEPQKQQMSRIDKLRDTGASMAASKFTGGYDIRQSNFWKERADKEILIKRQWFEKYFKHIYDERPKEMKCSKAEELIEKLTEQRKQNLQESLKIRAIVKQPKPLPLPESDPSVSLDVMRPVSPKVRRLLYKGISHEDEGRWLYLRKRTQLAPKQRYYFQETSGFGYGWHEPSKTLNYGSRFGKSSAPREDFYRRNGIGPDPSYWRSSMYNNYSYMYQSLKMFALIEDGNSQRYVVAVLGTRRAFQKIRQVNVSERPVSRRLDECGLNSRRPAKGPELLQQHRVERLRFAHNHANRNLGQ
ncbi:hypothetical protein ANN_01333 [Periplaneta americana]|uniref:Uncharacterized protein n=1 Tax=Periplaneta americana TaxID=6978 RepID=A0ABQ8TVP7_PERAM|nr:hypothetical protein ANN_01333 [Periplaneta americana]